MVFDPSLFHQPDNHWHETQSGHDAAAHQWPHDRALRHRVQDVGHALPADAAPRSRRRAEGPWFLGPSGHPENVLVKLKEPLQPDAKPLEVPKTGHGHPGRFDIRGVPSNWGILGGQQPGQEGVLPADCFPALPPRSLRHAIAYSKVDGQEQVHETKVTCSGDDCETMSNDVMPQIIRVRTPTRASKPRLCAGAPFQGPGLVWDSFDHLAHRVANSARRLFGYTADDIRQDAVPPPANLKSEGIMKSYVYFNNNGHEEMKQIESHCKDGTCVQRTRTFAPHAHAHASQDAIHRPKPEAIAQHAYQAHAAKHSGHQATVHRANQATAAGMQPYQA